MQLNISKKKYNIGKVFENIFIPNDVINNYIYKYLKFSDMIIFGLLNNKFKKDNEIIINGQIIPCCHNFQEFYVF